ncbi:WecB/TagA/CpsF family glycosyltransferase [Parachlamydia sp. AcF125]|uniref:WecB/TagA/CpsF family glycosyltransferase n=1 Tax=Parachlamydia sp. AcF125 TaxID=2795736 RepID=UPI001BC9E632|nr:WecB/TagA/CpsF family glycosyltransferase [Parachlamydia sp. AcF125]MBS4168031.1 N-acetylglucosaminyldiphosphoundecaprenol N-acetyl-beta-D-mannosaminyltransferase [Parachlamydia sp. AcF125]
MHPRALILLGIPVSDLTQEEAVQAIVKTIEAPAGPQKAIRYVGFMDREKLGGIWGWGVSTIDQREWLSMLFKSFLILPSDHALVWLSKALGTPLKEPIQEKEFLSELIKELVYKKKSIFFLGGNEIELKAFVEGLKRDYPEIQIAGMECPQIKCEGENLTHMDNLDDVLVEDINQTEPDLVWMHLGSPKQEIWLKRVKQRLKVPVAVGGGSFHSPVAGQSFMQKVSSWWQQFFSVVKFSWLSLPLITYQSLLYFFYHKKIGHSWASNVKDPLLFLSFEQSFVVFQLPPVLDHTVSDQILVQLKDALGHPCLTFDWSKVVYFDIEGLNFLTQLVTKVWREKKEIYCWGLASHLKYLLNFHRLWVLLAPYFLEDPRQFLSHFCEKERGKDHLYLSIQQRHAHLIVTFFGTMGNQLNYSSYLASWIPMIEDKECILDFTYCAAMDSRAFGFLLHLREYLKTHHKFLKICGLKSSLKQEFALTKVHHSFKFFDNIEEALAKVS